MSAPSPAPDRHDQQVASAGVDTTTVQPAKPTIVLVHGAWADSSSWALVIKRLRASGYPVYAIANPLQGLVSDTHICPATWRRSWGPSCSSGTPTAAR
jgi:alpha-beta hydrolase superfamily lysophospholipase